MSSIRNIGLLICRDEIDLLEPFMQRHVQFLDTIVAIDHSTDGSREMLLGFPQVKHLIKGEELTYPPPFCCGQRQAALEVIRELFGYGGWITLLHPDEWWVDDPNQAAADAEKEGADCVLWHALAYFLHVSQKSIYAQPGWERIPVRDRLTLFQPGFYEYRQFKNRVGADFNPQRHMQTTPDGTNRSAYLKAYSPVFSHYSTRNPEQALARAKDRLARSWHPGYQAFLNSVFFDRPMPESPLLGREHEQDAWLRAFPTYGHPLP
jgi:hypothetical protein